MRTTAFVIAVTAASVTGAAVSYADAPKFPDISHYAPVNPQDYVIELPNPGRPSPLQVTRFLTPDGITCSFSNTPSAGCTGNNFPAIPPASPSPGGGPRENGISTNAGLRQYGVANSDQQPLFKTLPPFHSITVDGVTCGVDDADTTACKDPRGQGFVLSPNGSGWLAHV